MERPAARRTQAERTAATRSALLEATVAVLADRGYAGTSTTEIARRAGVSRGGQLHHFPTKVDLVGAALDHVFAEREEAFRTRFAALPPEARNEAGAAQVFTEIGQGPHQLAVLELLNAARTDDELRPLARRVLRDYERSITEVFAEVVPGAAEDPLSGARVRVAMALLQSAGLHRELGLVDEAAELVVTLRVLADLFPAGA
ncbi:MAG TPA: helix-turn-helix domain-containing protein, partial [Aquihabitans sp.]|nr:helix-turn-helix domain-containing protein [Aquihabitans sp.]